jgi:hypothetical protein
MARAETGGQATSLTHAVQRIPATLITRIVARSMSSAGDIYYFALRDFGALMIEKKSD